MAPWPPGRGAQGLAIADGATLPIPEQKAILPTWPSFSLRGDKCPGLGLLTR